MLPLSRSHTHLLWGETARVDVKVCDGDAVVQLMQDVRNTMRCIEH